LFNFLNSVHVIVLLGLFLRLEQYGELIIKMDCEKTKQFIIRMDWSDELNYART